ncbi:MAG TPA: hypothetical protein PKA53_06945 [Sphingobacterium sp.]|nr:hypothetical protein [Sphingobacterium sp.]
MLQLITTSEELQQTIDQAVHTAFQKLIIAKTVSQVDTEIIDGKTLMQRLDISEPTLQRWRDKKRIPYIQEDSIIRYNWPKVLESLEKRRRGTR